MENKRSVDQKRAAVRRFMAEHAGMLSRQGSIITSWRRYKGQRLGPYHRLAFRLGHEQRSVYLGTDTALADEVRQALEKLRAPHRERLQLEQVRRALRRELAARDADLDQELRLAGLHRKGRQILGWRGVKRQ